eukprot:TRINITY_DN39181_c0_g1_i1.p1 TRINITY_DN39181_c0_g1~~TRINITY_DN39181_c0_g1_i1.p1  ORF type:complete len:121 (+),score=10.38 TRINITY_DN39181_c0_g1_i1:121-483(+)
MEFVKYTLEGTSWNTPLLGIVDDLQVCVQGTLCPFYLSAKNKADVEGRKTSFIDMLCCPAEYFTRQQIRKRLDKGFAPGIDMVQVFLCYPCVLCQHTRELKIHRDLAQSSYVPTTLEMGG